MTISTDRLIIIKNDPAPHRLILADHPCFRYQRAGNDIRKTLDRHLALLDLPPHRRVVLRFVCEGKA